MYKETGGIRYGSMNASWPLASIILTDESIQINILGIKSILFAKADILNLQKCKGIFSTGLKIEHKINNYPSFIVFWTFNINKLIEQLGTHGYTLSEETASYFDYSSKGGPSLFNKLFIGIMLLFTGLIIIFILSFFRF